MFIDQHICVVLRFQCTSYWQLELPKIHTYIQTHVLPWFAVEQESESSCSLLITFASLMRIPKFEMRIYTSRNCRQQDETNFSIRPDGYNRLWSWKYPRKAISTYIVSNSSWCPWADIRVYQSSHLWFLDECRMSITGTQNPLPYTHVLPGRHMMFLMMKLMISPKPMPLKKKGVKVFVNFMANRVILSFNMSLVGT